MYEGEVLAPVLHGHLVDYPTEKAKMVYQKPFPNEFNSKRVILYLGMDKQKTRRSGALMIAWAFQNQFNSRHSSLQGTEGERIISAHYFKTRMNPVSIYSFGHIFASKHGWNLIQKHMWWLIFWFCIAHACAKRDNAQFVQFALYTQSFLTTRP